MRKYILNLETSKVELHFDGKSEYNSLSNDLKKELKRNYIYSPSAGAWVSRSTQNHYRAIELANKLGFTEEERINERLTFEEKLKREQERAENKIARYESYAENAEKRANQLQSEFNRFRGDIAFCTQPNINSSAGRAFTNRRNKIMDRFGKGFEEFRKSDYFKEKANSMKNTVDGSKFKNRVYLTNRINECNKNIKSYEKSIVWCEQNNKTNKIDDLLSKMEYEIDKLAFIQNCLDDIGGIKYTASDLKIGYEIKVRRSWEKVIKINQKTVESEPIEEHLKMFHSKSEYSEIEDMRIPEGFKEKEEIKNPFKVDDIMVAKSYDGERIIKAYQIIKTTSKTVTIKEISINNNLPQKDCFRVDGKETRRQIKESKYNGNIYISDDNHILYKHTA
jgi:hypothetical protein